MPLLKRYLTIVLGRFRRRRRLHVIHGDIDYRVIPMRSSINARNGSLDLSCFSVPGFYSPM